jgi:peptide chain release factor 1
VVTCQDERSQLKNKLKAMRVLRARLQDAVNMQKAKEISKARKMQVGSGDRSEKIRTYNFPDRRVTDHRIDLTVHRLEQILDGDLDEFTDTLIKRGHDLRSEAT